MRRGARSLCLRLLVLFLVGVTFAGVYMFIKVTSFAGYKARRAPVMASGRAVLGAAEVQ